MKEVRLSQGTIRYRESGAGEPIVLVHGLLVDGTLWQAVTPLLERDFRVIAPDWPLGSHRLPLEDGTDRSPLGLAQIIADFMAALDLKGVTLVGNDTGGALCQLVAVNHPERLARLVLTPCDSFENFLPPAFRPLQLLAHIPGAVLALTQMMRMPVARRSPLAFGWLSKNAGAALTRSWIEPGLADAAIRRDTAMILKSISSRYTLEAASRFGDFEKPVLVAWAEQDRFFPRRLAERLVAAFPDGRLERIEDSYAFTPLDQPELTAGLIGDFAREQLAARATAG